MPRSGSIGIPDHLQSARLSGPDNLQSERLSDPDNLMSARLPMPDNFKFRKTVNPRKIYSQQDCQSRQFMYSPQDCQSPAITSSKIKYCLARLPIPGNNWLKEQILFGKILHMTKSPVLPITQDCLNPRTCTGPLMSTAEFCIKCIQKI